LFPPGQALKPQALIGTCGSAARAAFLEGYFQIRLPPNGAVHTVFPARIALTGAKPDSKPALRCAAAKNANSFFAKGNRTDFIIPIIFQTFNSKSRLALTFINL
jgi:hypothetical protein